MAEPHQHLANGRRSEQLVAIIDGLRAAKESHYSWLWDIHRAVLCYDPPYLSVELDPTRCGFSKWLRSLEEENELRDAEDFRLLQRQHILMHRAAVLLLQTATLLRPVPVEVYNDFIVQRNAFQEYVERFERDLWALACLIDQLTGLRNRHGMRSDLLEEQQRLIRDGGTCSIAMIDIDHFKTINDDYGGNPPEK